MSGRPDENLKNFQTEQCSLRVNIQNQSSSNKIGSNPSLSSISQISRSQLELYLHFTNIQEPTRANSSSHNFQKLIGAVKASGVKLELAPNLSRLSISVQSYTHTSRYGLLRGPSSSSCGELCPSAELFLAKWPKSAFFKLLPFLGYFCVQQ